MARLVLRPEVSARRQLDVRDGALDAARTRAELTRPVVSVGAGTVRRVTRILLVRHGQSEWNALGRWQGQADPPLTDQGRHQAKVAASAFGAVDAVVASDLQRAQETALIIAASLGVGPVVVDERLRERHAGEWQGLTRDEIREQWPGYLHDDRADAGLGPRAEQRRPPGWEPDRSVLERALAAFGAVASEVGAGDVVAVTHGALIYAVERHLGDSSGRIANLGGRWVEAGAGELALGERVLLVDPGDATVPGQL